MMSGKNGDLRLGAGDVWYGSFFRPTVLYCQQDLAPARSANAGDTWAHTSIWPMSMLNTKQNRKLRDLFPCWEKLGINKWCGTLARCLLHGILHPPFVFNLRCPRNVSLIFSGVMKLLKFWYCQKHPHIVCLPSPGVFHLPSAFLFFIWNKEPCWLHTQTTLIVLMKSSSCQTSSKLIHWHNSCLCNFIADN